MELGIVIDVSAPGTTAADITALAVHAETSGLDIVVIADDGTGTDTDHGTDGIHHLDPWTTAGWLAGATSRIQIAVAATGAISGASISPLAEGADPATGIPAVAARAAESLNLLAPGRTLTDPAAWRVVPHHATGDQIASAGAVGLPVVVPVATTADVDHVAALRPATEAPDSAAGHGPATGHVQPDGRLPVAARGPAPRTAAVRSRRRPGIDYDGVPAALAADAVEPGDPDYRTVSSTYIRGGAPGLVLRPNSPGQVADALAYARRHRQLPLALRSAGHGFSGRSTNDGGLVIDVGAMNAVEVIDAGRRLVRVGPGATWKQVSAALHPYGWAIGSGDYGGVGVGGLATAGGIGLLSRRQGLTIDRLRAVELVLADGQHVRTDDAHHSDLFWAVRGAGANFGVATAFEFEAEPLETVGWAQLTVVTDDLATALHRYGEVAAGAPRDTTAFLAAGRPRRGQAAIQIYAVVADPDPDVVIERLTPFAELGALAQQQVVMVPYAGVMAMAGDVGPEGHQGRGEPHARSGFLPALSPEFAHDAATMLAGGRVFFFALRPMGGAIADVPAHATAFAHRTPAFQVTALGADTDAMDAAWGPLRRHIDGLYLSFETGTGGDRLRDAFPPATLERLRRLKGRYDPDGLFGDNFPIDPHPADLDPADPDPDQINPDPARIRNPQEASR